MALTADQSAVLELLLGGQSFAGLADLLGLDEDEIRLRAREALGELGGTDPDRTVALSPYLLGQADPIGRADAVRHLRQDAGDYELAQGIRERLLEIAPGADLPELPPPPGGRRAPRPPRAPRQRAVRMPAAGNRLYLALGGAAVVLIVVVLAVSGVFSGDEPSSTGTEATADSSETPGEVAGDEVERIPLSPVGNGDAAGEGIVGITTGDQPYLDLRLENLDPPPNDKVYVVWFLFDQQTGYPLSPIAPDAQGNFEDRFAVPSPAIAVLARMRYLNVSLAPIGAVRKAIEDAVENQRIVIDKPGETVLQNAQPLSAQAGAGAGQAGAGAGQPGG